MSAKPKVLVTGASSGIGAVYADRFAKRGHDLTLVARDEARLRDIARRLERETGVKADILRADLTQPADLSALEAHLRDDRATEILINNAGIAAAGAFLAHPNEIVGRLIDLNITAPTRLAAAIAPRLAEAGRGAIVNIGSVVGFAPELGMTLYGASKAYVQYLSQGLQRELGPKGVYVQAVLPAATRTEIWGRAGLDVNSIPGMMDVEALVDAALAGFDRREAVTIPSLPDEAQWEAYQAARVAMLPNLRQSRPAARYLG
jgi:uncharacterized protein